MTKQYCKNIHFESEVLGALSRDLKKYGFNEVIRPILLSRSKLAGAALIQAITAECLARHFKKVRRVEV